jgi:hypothetical protein
MIKRYRWHLIRAWLAITGGGVGGAKAPLLLPQMVVGAKRNTDAKNTQFVRVVDF